MVLLFDVYQQPLWFVAGLIIVSLWELVWKGFALWHSAKNQQKGWYIAILILNTAGLLPIIYLIWFKQKKVMKEKTEPSKKPAKKESKKK